MRRGPRLKRHGSLLPVCVCKDCDSTWVKDLPVNSCPCADKAGCSMEFDAVHVCHTPENGTQIEACYLTISGLVFDSLTNITSCSVFLFPSSLIITKLLFSYLEHDNILHKALIMDQSMLNIYPDTGCSFKSSFSGSSSFFIKSRYEVSYLALFKLALPGVPTNRNGTILLLSL